MTIVKVSMKTFTSVPIEPIGTEKPLSSGFK